MQGATTQKVKGAILKKGGVISNDVEFSITTNAAGCGKSTTAVFSLPVRCQLPVDPLSPNFEVVLQDGRRFEFAIDGRTVDGILQHFRVKVVGLSSGVPG